jgi:hypothetical protein
MIQPVSVQASHPKNNIPEDSDLLPGMPEPGQLSDRATLERESKNYEEAITVHGPLVTPSIGSRLLNVSSQAVDSLMKRGKLTRLDFFGNPWVPVLEIRARMIAPREKGGRPHNLNGGRPRKTA